MNKKIKKSVLFATFGIVSTLVYMSTTSCSSLNAIVFGNFYSYISPEVQKRITTHQPINWQYYGSNQEIPTYLQNKTLNLAVSSNDMVVKLAKDNAISKIDYSLFELLNNNSIVKNANELKGLITQQAFEVATKAFQKYNINLLDYSIPYFLQNFCFAYRGPKIQELHDPNITFKDIFEIINKHPDFKQKSLMMVDDARTIFGLSKIVYDIEKNKPNININPIDGQLGSTSQTTIKQFEEIYSNLLRNINNSNTSFILNSDSNLISNKLAKNEVKAAFLYNGDAIFAAQGGDYSQSSSLPNDKDFHIVVPKQTIIIMDSIILNKKNSVNENLQSLKLAYQLSFSGLPTSKYNEYNIPYNIDPTKIDSRTLNILEETNDSYTYMPMENFSYINYSPVIQKIYDYATGTYFDQYAGIGKLMKETIQIKIDPNNIQSSIEMPLTDLTESNMKVAYITFKNNVK